MKAQMEENKDIQEYADAHCGGDRLRAIYDIISSGEECCFDPYVDSLTTEEANFTLLLLRNEAVWVYGGEASYKKALRHYSILASLGLEEEDLKKPNPFTKPLLKQLALLLCAVLIPAVLIGVLDASWIASVQPILIGLTAMSTANALLSFLRFNKVKKYLASIDDLKPTGQPVHLTFEEAMAQYNSIMPPKSTPAEAEKALHDSKKANISVLSWYPAFCLLTTVSIFAAYMNPVAGSVCCALIAAFFMWKVPYAFKAVLRAKKAVDGLPGAGQPQQNSFEKRQNGCAFAMIGLGLLYLLGGLFSIAMNITMMVR